MRLGRAGEGNEGGGRQKLRYLKLNYEKWSPMLVYFLMVALGI